MLQATKSFKLGNIPVFRHDSLYCENGDFFHFVLTSLIYFPHTESVTCKNVYYKFKISVKNVHDIRTHECITYTYAYTHTHAHTHTDTHTYTHTPGVSHFFFLP